jgi:hypothetical protein
MRTIDKVERRLYLHEDDAMQRENRFTLKLGRDYLQSERHEWYPRCSISNVFRLPGALLASITRESGADYDHGRPSTTRLRSVSVSAGML